MTCKVSFFNSIRETLKHHIASTFASVLAFFIQFLIFFLAIQNEVSYIEGAKFPDIADFNQDIIDFLEPNYTYYIPVVIVAIILAFDYFRYLHSKKQMDFYESLPIKRKDWFALKTACSFLVFLVPYLFCTITECIVLYAYDLRIPAFYTSLLWNVICMILIFAVTWITAVLAMVMTGHSVIATFGMAVFCAYAPIILRFLFPLYADRYFETYVSSNYTLRELTYISPIGLAINLIGDAYDEWFFKDHIKDFVILLVILVLMFLLTFRLFCKRASEAAGRAMAFEKCNPVIRILLVIPLSLYLGRYLSSVANVFEEVWMVIGFILGVILLHGIIESIFQFDIRGLWSHKLQMGISLLATIGIASLFWFELLGYDTYMPNKESLEVNNISMSDPYYHRNSDSDGLHGEQLDMAYELIESAIEDKHNRESNGVRYLRVSFIRKNGRNVERKYYIDSEKHMDKIDALYASKDYKDDICLLYKMPRENVTRISWFDNVTDYPLILSESQQDKLFDTYLAEFTPYTFSEVLENQTYGGFEVSFDWDNGYEYEASFTCFVFPQFKQTIALLEEYIAENELTANYGVLDTKPFERYAIRSIELYADDRVVNIEDPETIALLKDSLINSDDFYIKHNGFNSGEYFDGTVQLITHDGISYMSILVPTSEFYKHVK